MSNFRNFAKAVVNQGYDGAATGIELPAGHGARLPAPPFAATWWNATDFPDPSDDPNREIVLVTAVNGDALTVSRGQEETVASAKNLPGKTYQLVAGLTAGAAGAFARREGDTLKPARLGLMANDGAVIELRILKRADGLYYLEVGQNPMT